MQDVEKGRVQGRPLRCRFEIASRGGCQWTRKVNSGINAYLLDSSSSPGETFHLTNCKCLTRHSIGGNHESHAESWCGAAPSVGDARPDTRNPGEVVLVSASCAESRLPAARSAQTTMLSLCHGTFPPSRRRWTRLRLAPPSKFSRGTYTEEIVITKDLHVEGAGVGATILQSPATLTPFAAFVSARDTRNTTRRRGSHREWCQSPHVRIHRDRPSTLCGPCPRHRRDGGRQAHAGGVSYHTDAARARAEHL